MKMYRSVENGGVSVGRDLHPVVGIGCCAPDEEKYIRILLHQCCIVGQLAGEGTECVGLKSAETDKGNQQA